MATKPFKYQPMFPNVKPDNTEYYLLTKEHVSVAECNGKEILVVEPEALTKLANAAMRDVSLCCVVSTMKWWPKYFMILKQAITINL